MGNTHNLDLYVHKGDHSCLGCVAAEEGAGADSEAGASGGGAAAGGAPTPTGGAAGAGGAAGGGATPPETPPDAPPLGQEHLIEVQIVNAAGAPVRGLACEVTLPDGSKRGGTTTADGYLRLSVSPHTGAFTLDLPDAAFAGDR
ncbi:MAG TPA: hypothetical protein VG389_18780 [Myxococcota bacterium]|jgi:hypothetical protein|nr:hypothetical protein [Myxococcota bacterium]